MKMPTDRDIATAVGPLIDQARTAGMMESARLAQATLNELRTSGAADESIQVVESLMRQMFEAAGIGVPAEPLRTVPDLQRETLALLSLYIGRPRMESADQRAEGMPGRRRRR